MQIFNANDTNITDCRPKVVETHNGFLLNTNYYEKETLSPVPFENLNFYGSYRSLSIDKQLYCSDYSWHKKDTDIGIIPDENFQNRYYIQVLSGYKAGSARTTLYAIEEQDYKIKCLYEYNIGDSEFTEYISQDENYLWVTVKGGVTCWFNRIDKHTFTAESRWSNSSNSYPQLKKVCETPVYIYLCTFLSNNFYFIQYNKSTNTATECHIYRADTPPANQSNYNPTIIQSEPIDMGDGVYGVYCVNIGNTAQPIDLYIVDTKLPFVYNNYSSACSIQHCNIGWGAGCSSILYSPTISSPALNYRCFITEFNNKKYLNVAVYNDNYDNLTYLPYQGIYTFRFNNNTSFSITGFNKLDTAKLFGGLLLNKSRKYGLIPKNASAQLIKFDEAQEKYITTGIEIDSLYSIGFDSLGRIWYEHLDESVHIINVEDAQKVNVSFEKKYYDFTGNSIETYIKFSATNYLDDQVVGKFKLIMTGSAVFQENDSQELTFDYNGVEIQIGIVINGVSPVTIYPTFIS